jgi:hypothetical protein
MSNPLFSKKFSIVIDGSTLLCPTDFNFSASKDMDEIACLGASGAKRVIPGMYGATFGFSGIVSTTASIDSGKASLETLMAKFKTDASCSVYFLPDVSANTYYSAPAFLNSINWGGGVGSLAVTYDAEATMDGDWTVNTTA